MSPSYITPDPSLSGQISCSCGEHMTQVFSSCSSYINMLEIIMLVCLFTSVFFIHYLRTVEIYFFYTIGMSGHCYFNCMLCFNDVSYVQTHILFIFVYKHVYVLQYIVSVYIQIQCFVVCNGTTAIPYQALIFSQLHKTVNTMVHVLRYTLLLIHVLSGTSLHRIVWCSFLPTCTFINESD